MRVFWSMVCAATLAAFLAQSVQAQRPDRDRREGDRPDRREGARDGDRGRRPGGDRGPGRPGFGGPPIIAALDANSDGEISADEIDRAIVALKSLDKNKDGKLTRQEMFGDFGGRGGPGGRPDGAGRPGGRPDGAGRPGGRPDGAGRPGGDFSPEAFIARVMENDKNGDGKVSKEEATGRMKDGFDRFDTNSDGFVDKQEVTAMMQRFGRGRGGDAGGRRGGGRPEGRPEGGRPRSRESDDN